MLSNYELRVLKLILAFVTKLNLVEVGLQSPDLGGTRLVERRGLRSCIGVVGLFCHIGSVGVCLLRVLTADSVSVKALIGFLGISLFAAVAFRIALILNGNEIAALCNNVLVIRDALNLRFEDEIDKLNPKANGESTTMRGKLYFALVVGVSVCLIASTSEIVAINFVMFPTWWARAIYVLTSAFSMIIYLCGLVISAGIFIPSILVLRTGMKMACIDGPKNLETSESCCIYIYRCMQLLNQLHNTVYGTVLMPLFKVTVILCIYLAVFCVVRLRASLHVFVYALFFVYLFTLILVIISAALLMSTVFNVASKFHGNMINRMQIAGVQDVKIQKRLRSIPVLKCTIGNFYHMESEAKLTLLDNVVHGIAFCLLSTRGIRVG